MELYSVEIFNTKFEPLGNSAISRTDIEYDYIATENITVELARKIDGITQMSPVRVLKNGKEIYNGIAMSWEETDTGLSLEIAPWAVLFDQTYDNVQQADITTTSIEQHIADFLRLTYTQIPELFATMVFDVQTETFAALAEGNTVNMIDYITSALKTYGIIVKFAPLYGLSKVAVTIGAQADSGDIYEIDTKNIINADVQFAGNGLRYTVIAPVKYAEDGTKTTYSKYYLAKDGNIYKMTSVIFPDGKEPVEPIITKNVEVTEEEVTDDTLMELAKAELIQTDDDQSIIVDCMVDDKIVTLGIDNIGQKISVMYKGQTYTGRMTAYAETGKVKTITIGNVRKDLTKKLKIERYKKG